MSRLAMALVGLFLCAPVFGAVGVFDLDLAADEGGASATVTYRINCPASVTIAILNESGQPVCALGPYEETAGEHTHQWDGSGSSAGHNYRARVTAANAGIGTAGTLVPLFTVTRTGLIYGVAVDRSVSSPAYGTIYASETCAGGAIRAYHADGSPKNGFGGNPADNLLLLGFAVGVSEAPWGLGVDSQGNIYAARKSPSANAIAVKVFDCQGTLLHDVLTSTAGGIFWAEGQATADGLEVYETFGTQVRCKLVTETDWRTVMGPAVSNWGTRQICFEQGGACYVATQKTVVGTTSPGIRRYTRSGQSWTQDTGFDVTLDNLVVSPSKVSDYAVGVSCDAKDPDGSGPYTASCLWIGLADTNQKFSAYGGNIVRQPLPTGDPQFFAGPGVLGRMVAADAVGNVAIEDGTQAATAPWTRWGLYVVGGESSSDVRVTTSVTLQSAASPELVSAIADLRNRPDGGYVELTAAKTVSAVFGDGFYLQEPGRSGGVKVVGAGTPAEGSTVKVRGSLSTVHGERVLSQAQIVP